MVEAITSVARAQMREDGVAALNLNEVARRVGMTAPALYRYFPSKAAVYDALFRLGTRLYREELESRNLGAAPSALIALRGAIEQQLSFALRYPELQQLVFQRPVPGFVPSKEALKEAAELEEVGRASFRRLIARGIIAPKRGAEKAFNLLLAVMNGLTDAHIANEPHLPVGKGRFGGLVLDAASLLAAAWSPTAGSQVRDAPEE